MHGGERGPVTFPAFKAGDSALRESNGGFDFHTPPPNVSPAPASRECLTDARVGAISSEDMRNRLTAFPLVVLGSLVAAAPSYAQRFGGVVFAPVGRSGPAVLRGTGGTGSAHKHRTRRFFSGSGLAPNFYSDFEPETVEGAPPQVVTIPAPPVAQTTRPAESVLLELHGDRWVRITNYGASANSGAAEPERATPVSATLPPVASHRDNTTREVVSELPRAALVFRDGHTEEIQKYVIVGPTLYTTADYWTTGSWTRKIAIADLNVPATLQLNQGRGAKFTLPSGPTEVMMRP
jgi:hypothetical protein